MLFLDQLQANCQRLPNKTALEFIANGESELITYGQLETVVQQTMGYLQSLDVQAGDRVAVQLPKCIPFIYLHLIVLLILGVQLLLSVVHQKDLKKAQERSSRLKPHGRLVK